MFDRRLESVSHIRESDVVRSDLLSGAGIRHAFFTRGGGVSRDVYAGLNVGIGSHDNPQAVHENRNRAMHFLGLTGPELVTPWQVHSTDVVIVEAPFGSDRPKADAVVTNTPGLAIGVVTADCGPVLFSDPVAGIVGAAHAGWRGAVGGILEATVEAMERVGANRGEMVAVLGPTITQPNYEVGADMAESVVAGDPEAERFFSPGTAPDKRQFDLPGLIDERLRRAGVRAAFVDRCTYADEDAFFSFRRTTHRGESDYGRQLSAILIER